MWKVPRQAIYHHVVNMFLTRLFKKWLPFSMRGVLYFHFDVRLLVRRRRCIISRLDHRKFQSSKEQISKKIIESIRSHIETFWRKDLTPSSIPSKNRKVFVDNFWKETGTTYTTYSTSSVWRSHHYVHNALKKIKHQIISRKGCYTNVEFKLSRNFRWTLLRVDCSCVRIYQQLDEQHERIISPSLHTPLRIRPSIIYCV